MSNNQEDNLTTLAVKVYGKLLRLGRSNVSSLIEKDAKNSFQTYLKKSNDNAKKYSC